MTMTRKNTVRSKVRPVVQKEIRRAPVPRALRARVEALLNENYAFMDSPVFRRKNIDAELFTFEDDNEPQLPLTSWYQPTRDEMLDTATTGAPQLMKGN
ncbi:MAG: hypothetical protein H7Z14_19380, partial [Anaerolineae bacterium]|nr:hypothetical protein [Phycisphaerae bacterium]